MDDLDFRQVIGKLEAESDSNAELVDLAKDLLLELDTQRLIAGVASELMLAPPQDVHAIVRAGLRAIAERLGVQRGYVFLLTPDESALADAVEWCADGVLEHDFDVFKGVPVTAFPWTMEHLRNKLTVVVQDPEQLPDVASPERGACEAMAINDYVNTGLDTEDSLLGWLGFDSVGTKRTWSDRDLRLVRAAADVVAAGLARKRRDQALQRQQEMSNRVATVGALTAGLAHEINNPLTFVMGNLRLLEDWLDNGRRSSDAEIREIIGDAYEGADRIGSIVRDLRSFARIEKSEGSSTDLKEALDSTLRMVATEIRPRASVVARYGALPKVVGSSSQVSQMFLNLLVNAINAIPEGRASENFVTVEAAVVNGSAQVTIADTGVGIAPDVLSRIFDPFFTTRDVGSGRGLGLTISHNIVHRLGGTLDGTSEVGKGTVMTIRLPLADADADAGDAEAASKHEGETNADRRLTVLIVDDESGMLIWLKRLVEGHRVLLASSGRKALDMLREEPNIDVVLCDLMMPEMNGMDLYTTLQREKPELARRFTFITGGVFTEAVENFLTTVPNEVVYKPFGRETVQRVLAKAIRPTT